MNYHQAQMLLLSLILATLASTNPLTTQAKSRDVDYNYIGIPNARSPLARPRFLPDDYWKIRYHEEYRQQQSGYLDSQTQEENIERLNRDMYILGD